MDEDNICRLCFSILREDTVHFIKDLQAEILETLAIKLDLSISEDSVICTSCQQNMEKHFNFKAQCVINEDYITSFFENNRVLNLREFFSGEEEQLEYICRLCMKFTDDCNILNDNEKGTFAKFFPEINLNATDCESMCTKCYISLQSYFKFATMCLEWEDKLHLYYNVVTRKMVPLNLNDFRRYVDNLNSVETEQKYQILPEELQIKEEPFDDMSLKTEKVIIKKLKEKPYKYKQKCKYCPYESPTHMKRHVASVHAAMSKILLKCNICKKQFKTRGTLERHKYFKHSDNVQKYKCALCTYESIFKGDLKKHLLNMHTDPSKVKLYNCEMCDYKTKYKGSRDNHILLMHTDMDNCEELNQMLLQAE